MVSRVVTDGEDDDLRETIASIDESHDLALAGAPGQKIEKMEAGFEPLTQSPSSLNKTNTGSHPRSQGNKSPSDLQEIIAVWLILPDPLKAAVLAIIRSVAGGGR